MDNTDIKVEVLDDNIILKSTGTLITTTWIHAYGDILSSISKIKSAYKEQKDREGLLNYNPDDVKQSNHKDNASKMPKGIHNSFSFTNPSLIPKTVHKKSQSFSALYL